MSMTVHRICTSYVPGVTKRVRALDIAPDQAATEERSDNVRLVTIGRQRAAVEKLKLWENGRTLRVKFLDGHSLVQDKVAEIAKEWEKLTNLQLSFVSSGAADIRISFAEQGFSWSTLGTDALTVPASEPTMNYGWLEPDTSQREYERVVRHEFGHALGMIHEHQNPEASIPWDKPKVYAYYAQQGWTREDVDFNIFDVYTEASTNHTAFDPTSIMQYAVPDSLTTGSFSIGWNTEFSAQDIAFMSRQYPMNKASDVTLTVGKPQASSLGAGGEVDSYRFEISEAATYIMATEGALDTVLTLQGPNDAGAVLTWDDDRGKKANARIVRKLLPGKYWLAVRHKSAVGVGDYVVQVKKSG